MKPWHKIVLAILIYLQIAFFTGAWRYNNIEDPSAVRGIVDLYSAVFWPIYWNTKLALWVTK